MHPVQPPPASRNLNHWQRLFVETVTVAPLDTERQFVAELAAKIEREARALCDTDELAPHNDMLALIERAAKMIKERMLEPEPRDDGPLAEAMQDEAA